MRDNEIEKVERNYKRLSSDIDVDCSGEKERQKEERDNIRLLVSKTTVMQNGETARAETILDRNGTII